ncbi:MAG: 50S ribosomal protein L15 [Candidatus Sericytochromatia bacterium]|nr:50S ribosomal protein L15 [Candidatus Sericytochromatia bacterium]
MHLTDLRPAEGATHPDKRVGRGHGSGMGKTSTRGYNGQGQRSGRSIKLGHEGGQMPLYRRLPKKKHFRMPYRPEWSVINVADLADFAKGSVVDALALIEAGKIKRERDGVRILGVGELSVALTVKAHHVSASAREKIEAAGGSIELLGVTSEAESN